MPPLTASQSQLLDIAQHDPNGQVRVEGDWLRADCLVLARKGLMVQISRYVFSLPEGG